MSIAKDVNDAFRDATTEMRHVTNILDKYYGNKNMLGVQIKVIEARELMIQAWRLYES